MSDKREPITAFGEALLEVGEKFDTVVALSADSSKGSGMAQPSTGGFVVQQIFRQNGVQVPKGERIEPDLFGFFDEHFNIAPPWLIR